jgi:hypothetical protein
VERAPFAEDIWALSGRFSPQDPSACPHAVECRLIVDTVRANARNSVKQRGNDFPVLEGLDLRNMVLTTYIIKHLRDNTLLQASHNNGTFDFFARANSLIKDEVFLTGISLRADSRSVGAHSGLKAIGIA